MSDREKDAETVMAYKRMIRSATSAQDRRYWEAQYQNVRVTLGPERYSPNWEVLKKVCALFMIFALLAMVLRLFFCSSKHD